MARIVASSMHVTREDPKINLSGTAVGVRSYGTKTNETFPNNNAVQNGEVQGQINRIIDPTIIRNSYFQQEVNMKEDKSALYLNTIPLDYSDLDMTEVNKYFGDNLELVDAAPRAPILSGKVTGLSDLPAKLRFRFDVVIEYCPSDKLITMVQRKPTTQNTGMWEKAVNFVSNPRVLNGIKSFIGATPYGGIINSVGSMIGKFASGNLQSGPPLTESQNRQHAIKMSKNIDS